MIEPTKEMIQAVADRCVDLEAQLEAEKKRSTKFHRRAQAAEAAMKTGRLEGYWCRKYDEMQKEQWAAQRRELLETQMDREWARTAQRHGERVKRAEEVLEANDTLIAPLRAFLRGEGIHDGELTSTALSFGSLGDAAGWSVGETAISMIQSLWAIRDKRSSDEVEADEAERRGL